MCFFHTLFIPYDPKLVFVKALLESHPHPHAFIWGQDESSYFCFFLTPTHFPSVTLRRIPLFMAGLSTPPPWSTPRWVIWPTTRVRCCTTRETVVMTTTTPLTRSRRSPWLVIQPRAWLSGVPCLPEVIALRPTEHLRYTVCLCIYVSTS